MNWRVKTLYLYRNNKRWPVKQLYEEVMKETGSNRLYIVKNIKYWYQNGELHRETGPAVEYANGSKWWYLSDTGMSEEEFNEIMKEIED